MNEDGKKSILKFHLVHVLPIGELAESWNLITIGAKGKISFGISCYFAGIFLESLESFWNHWKLSRIFAIFGISSESLGIFGMPSESLESLESY